jgi:hypothetical protein
MSITLPAPVQGYIDASNAGDGDALIDWFADNALVNAVTDGEYDKTGLPDPLVLTYYFTVRDDRIVRLIIIHNEPTPAWAQQ